MESVPERESEEEGLNLGSVKHRRAITDRSSGALENRVSVLNSESSYGARTHYQFLLGSPFWGLLV